MTLAAFAPKISVVMPVYNGQAYLAEAIQSILKQTFVEFELIVIDDASTDSSRAIAASFTDHRLVLLHNETNQGVSRSSNLAVAAARSSYIARMDCDDLAMPDRLEKQYRFLKGHPEVDVLGTAAYYVEESGTFICVYSPWERDDELKRRLPRSPFINPTVCFKKDKFLAAGGYPEYMRWGGEDTLLFLRMARSNCFANLHDPLISYRMVPGSMSRKSREFRKRLHSIIEAMAQGGPEPSAAALSALADLYLESGHKESRATDYHLEIAKLALWSGADRALFRKHIAMADGWRKNLPTAAFLMVASLIPNKCRRLLYSTLKDANFHPL